MSCIGKKETAHQQPPTEISHNIRAVLADEILQNASLPFPTRHSREQKV